MTNNPSDTRIKKLSPLLINQLAAGEVVTRPAAVVKELLENAIDAGATHIEVHVTQGGMGMIEVVDNGVGIHPDDMIMAITRHATSKVADVANLHGIMTLGFRGEALAATAAVSRLTLISSHDNSGIGRQLQVAGVLDDIPKLSPVVHNRGTTITVRDLYFNVPARRGNLKSMAIEFGHIETVVRDVALARADITIILFHDKKKRLSLSASAISTNAIDSDNNRLSVSRLEQAIGRSLTDDAIEVAVDLSGLVQQSSEYNVSQNRNHAAITGWLWPMHEKNDALPKLIYVNGRLVKEAIISNQLRQIAQEAQLAGIGYALYFDLPTEWLNINVHPSKQRIRISPLNNIMAHLSHALRSKLAAHKATSSLQQDNSPSNDGILNTDSVKSDLINQPFEKALANTASINPVTQGRQVQSPKISYQLSENNKYPKHVDSLIEKPLIQKTGTSKLSSTDTDTITILSQSAADTTSLPYCLDIITSISDIAPESVIGQYSHNKPLPWLLFYYQKQCILIGSEDWRVKIGLLFESAVLDSHVFKKGEGYARDVNQQLATISAQMTQQDLALFITDIETLLVNNAIKVIDRNQLVTLMLNSI
ncbi:MULTISPECIES: DNA mismatch repair endonuclease MutL [Psychrobacter]|uniref:DNA mismatch repair protein MutL n=1 Tax=Psychrobacter alimentarius TaxID=261164 RepID=A0ABN4N2B7_9GAMM|nr:MULTISPECIES: DNA mismatch repair endonuclease MutL [Psychrobacter]AMT97108.1 DNA mismatch repair protein MutL [Psychrobacter alimentarius]QCB30559.1 ATPase [Psychrobacter sp. PAMC27889]